MQDEEVGHLRRPALSKSLQSLHAPRSVNIPLASVPLNQRAEANVTPVIITREYFNTWRSVFAHPFAVSDTYPWHVPIHGDLAFSLTLGWR
jgi:hypothetical protein